MKNGMNDYLFGRYALYQLVSALCGRLDVYIL